MFRSFRRKPAQKEESPPPPLRASPSLPELASQGIPWPEDLVDLDAIRAPPLPPPPSTAQQGAAKTSLSSPEPIPWHKPFRTLSTTDLVKQQPPASNAASSISAIYMSSQQEPKPSLDGWRGSATASPVSGPRPSLSHRRTRARAAPPQFNIMVAGAQGTGKTSLLRLLLDSSDISPGASGAQRIVLERFLRGAPRRTHEPQTIAVELAESRFERVLLSVTDTPGLDLRPGRELTLERQVSALVRRLDEAYAETMSEESKVVRQSKGDRHIHLIIYVIDPASLMSAAARRDSESSALPAAVKTRSDTTVSAARHADETSASHDNDNDTPPLTDDNTDTESDDAPDAGDDALTMAPADLRVLRRLAARANVLPVLGRADALSDARLRAAKEAVHRELARAELNFGVFSPPPALSQEMERERGRGRRSAKSSAEPEPEPESKPDAVGSNGDTNGHAAENGNGVSDDGSEDGARVIKLRTGRRASSATRARSRSRSRARMDLASEARDDREPALPDEADADAVPNARFFAAQLAPSLSALLPFALVAPEHTRRHRRAVPAPWDDVFLGGGGDEAASSAAGHGPTSPRSTTNHGAGLAALAPPEDLRGVFTRAFRWGTVDVLDPAHCDFSALRTAILSTHMKVLQVHTREVLYERFRTEKLLVRRATQKIGEKEAKQLFEDLLAADSSD